MTVVSPSTAPPGAPATGTRRNRSILEILLYAAGFVGVLWLLAGWSLPVIILLIVGIVVMHELGHFVTARWTGMKATQFFVGFGPRLWSRQVGETEVGVKAIWIGGYVRILGMTSQETLARDDEPRSFRQATYPRRVLVASAGSLMHLFMALVLAWCVMLVIGPVSGYRAEVEGFTTWSGSHETAAQLAGLQVGDRIISVNGQPITANDNAGITQISDSPGKPVILLVRRAGEIHRISVTPRDGGSFTESLDGQTTPTTKNVGYIGVAYQPVAVHTPASFWSSIPDTFSYLGSIIKAIGVGTYHVFSPAGVSNIIQADTSSRVATSTHFTDTYRPTSILGIVQIGRQLWSQDPSQLLILFMVLNLGIGALNMLPMLPLDGGYVAIATYERLRSRKGTVPYRADVNKLMPVVYAFVILLLVIALSTLYIDIRYPLHL